MAYTVELVGRRVGKGRFASGEQKWMVHGTSDQGLAYALVHASSPAVWEGLIKQDVAVEELGIDTWRGMVTYGLAEKGEVGDISWSFEIGTRTLKTLTAIDHVQSYPAGAPDHKMAMNVSGTGENKKVEGTDVFLPFFSWEEMHYIPWNMVTVGYIQTLETVVGHINSAPWRIWAKGELLLLGVSGAKQAEQPVGLTFHFAVSRTKTNITKGDITGIDKEGWHYLWIEFGKEADGNNLILPPMAVHVERVYDYANFNILSLTDPWA